MLNRREDIYDASRRYLPSLHFWRVYVVIRSLILASMWKYLLLCSDLQDALCGQYIPETNIRQGQGSDTNTLSPIYKHYRSHSTSQSPFIQHQPNPKYQNVALSRNNTDHYHATRVNHESSSAATVLHTWLLVSLLILLGAWSVIYNAK